MMLALVTYTSSRRRSGSTLGEVRERREHGRSSAAHAVTRAPKRRLVAAIAATIVVLAGCGSAKHTASPGSTQPTDRKRPSDRDKRRKWMEIQYGMGMSFVNNSRLLIDFGPLLQMA